MGRIEEKFARLKEEGRSAFIPYIAAGDPDLKTTGELIIELQERGADIIELGVPFSDPIADGPVIQKASVRALSNGVSVKKICEMLKTLKNEIVTPIVLMTYFNPVLKYGVDRFIEDFMEAGVDGIIVPDLPPDEGEWFAERGRSFGFDTIFLLAPTSGDLRIKKISRASRGYIYYVSVLGVTGARKSLSKTLGKNIQHIKNIAKIPVCVGFGISTPAQVREVASMADGVIVGSAIIKVIEENIGKKSLVDEVGKFVGELIGGIRRTAGRKFA